jgi:uncharacterized protein (DUF1800 family)
MKTTRRLLLKASALGSAAALSSCERVTNLLSRELGQGVPDELTVAQGKEIDPDFHLLSRATFGPRPGDLQKLKAVGRESWLEEQLHPKNLDDSLCDLRAGWFESLSFSPGDAYEFRREVLRDEITRHAMLRAIYSSRQLQEVMVEFWTDHLNIDLEKGDCVYLKPHDDREVIRKHALGKFRDLIRASATSPAMLVYLDGRDNKVRAGKGDKPNENYGRELLELHTLGVNGGYTQEDVLEAARCLTGWTVDLKGKFLSDMNLFRPARGVSHFKPEWHDNGAKTVLGQMIPAGGGRQDLEKLVDIVCSHASTAQFIATKLCRKLVQENPPPSLVQKVAEEFMKTQGDIKSLLRVLLLSEEFAASRGQLFKRPFRFIVSSLRGTAADSHAKKPLLDYLHRMDQGLFQHPTPDGYPDEESPWMGTLLWRWNYAFALAGNKLSSVSFNSRQLINGLGFSKASDTDMNRVFAHFIGRQPGDAESAAIQNMQDKSEALGAILASPAFQRC